MTQLRAVIFDLDGTLTTLEVDFSELRRELGIDQGPVWESILAMSGQTRRQAEQALVSAELAGARKCKFIRGSKQILAELGRKGLGRGILTRNCRQAVDIVIARHGLEADAILTREDGLLKPDPAGVIELSRRLETDPTQTLVVGDYLFDIQAGQRAGAKTVLFWQKDELPEYAHLADYVINDLHDLMDIADR